MSRKPSAPPEIPQDTPAWAWPEATWRGVVNRVRAGRSLKPETWPSGARVAVALSFDSDHETTTLREGSTSPGGMAAGEYGARVGVPRILALLEKLALPASFFVPAVVARLHPEEQKRIVQAGHELALHGWIHENTGTLPPEVEQNLMERAMETLTGIGGSAPVGMRTPSWDFSLHTLSIARELGLRYDSSLMADDDPYELLEDGEPTGVIELPPEWIRDDAVYFNMNRQTGLRPHTPPSAVLEIWKAEFDGAWREGGVFLLTMHPHIIGHRSRLPVLEALVRHIRATPGGAWFCTHAQLAEYVKAHAA